MKGIILHSWVDLILENRHYHIAKEFLQLLQNVKERDKCKFVIYNSTTLEIVSSAM